MKALVRDNDGHQKAGGLAALYLALAYLIAMPYFLIAVDYLGVTDPVEKVALLAEHQGSMSAMYLITYVIFGIVLAVLSLTLYRRMKDGAPVADAGCHRRGTHLVVRPRRKRLGLQLSAWRRSPPSTRQIQRRPWLPGRRSSR